ncbi:MAG: hypothetical protein NW206_20760 [Hyphomonadaceae bacterium]|nr:hypothetical protein [Hyphomonadaceae bacterium]
MPIIDPNKNPVGVHERLQGETNPRFRRMLEEVRFHIAVEAGGDIEPAIARLVPNCEYIIYNHAQQPVTIRGHDAVRSQFYVPLFEAIDVRLEWDIVLCMVDDHAVITEGRQKQAVKGATLIQAGHNADPNRLYLQHSHHMVVWPFDSELRLIGETVFMGFSQPLEEVVQSPLKAEDIADYNGPRYDLLAA